jgi:hypothetical protein
MEAILFTFAPFSAGLIDVRKMNEVSLFHVSRCKRLAQKQGETLITTRTNSLKTHGQTLTG